MKDFSIVGTCLILIISWLILERFWLYRSITKIPLRICVTGTRGKSSVVRLVASILTESGMKVLAKTTGSKPVLILPGGEEKTVFRWGTANILEQKKVIKIAKKFGVDAIVIEIMSIHPENHFVESVLFLNSNITLITNIRLDHLNHMGSTKQEIAETLSLTIPQNGTVFMPDNEFTSYVLDQAVKYRSTLVIAKPELPHEVLKTVKKLPYFEFKENIDLVFSFCEFLKIPVEKISQGILSVKPDFGSLRIQTIHIGTEPCSWLMVNAFAANDPESTIKAWLKFKERYHRPVKRVVGLLNLRADRGERTLQWHEALQDSNFNFIQRLILTGTIPSCLLLRDKLKKVTSIDILFIPKRRPEAIINRLYQIEKNDIILFGFGNIGGVGSKLVNFWEDKGIPYVD